MRTITLRQLSEHLFTELKDLPLEVTRYGKPYVIITDTLENKKEIKGKYTGLDLSKEYNPVGGKE